MEILLPVDGSGVRAKRFLNCVATHDELLGEGRECTFFTAIAPVPAHLARVLDRSALDGCCVEQAEQVFKPVRAFAQQRHWNHRALRAHGHAAEEIARLAEADKYDLIIMGSHGHTSLGSGELGSVTSGVLARCKVPVLLAQ